MIECQCPHFHSFPYHKLLKISMNLSFHSTLPETASYLRNREVRKAITRNPRGNVRPISKRFIMQLYEIYQNIVITTSISCIIGLAVAWVLFLSNRNK